MNLGISSAKRRRLSKHSMVRDTWSCIGTMKLIWKEKVISDVDIQTVYFLQPTIPSDVVNSYIKGGAKLYMKKES